MRKPFVIGACLLFSVLLLALWLRVKKVSDGPPALLFQVDPSLFVTDDIRQWAAAQKQRADEFVSKEIPLGDVPVALRNIGDTNRMKVMIIPYDISSNAFVNVTFGGGFRRWGLIIGSPALAVQDVPRGEFKILAEGFIVYDSKN